ncbi:unnamed protein product [Lampetra planeri]
MSPLLSLLLLLLLLLPVPSAAQRGALRFSVREEEPPGTVIARLADLFLEQQRDGDDRDGEEGSDAGAAAAGAAPSRFVVMDARGADLPLGVHGRDGTLSVARALDREALCPRADPGPVAAASAAACVISMDVAAEFEEPRAAFRLVRVHVEVLDVNDHAPEFPRAVIPVEVSESAPVGTRFPLDAARDPDVGENARIEYSLAPSQHFRLEVGAAGPGQAALAELVVTRALDREERALHELRLTARDAGATPRAGAALVRVSVLDTNDNSPAWARAAWEAEVREDAAAGSTVARLSASDPDEGPSGEVVYSLSAHAGPDARRLFRVDASTGLVTLVRALDREQRASHTVHVQASDLGPHAVPAHSLLTVRVIDVNDNEPALRVRVLAERVSEAAPRGTLVAHVTAWDADAGDDGRVSVELLEEGGGGGSAARGFLALVARDADGAAASAAAGAGGGGGRRRRRLRAAHGPRAGPRARGGDQRDGGGTRPRLPAAIVLAFLHAAHRRRERQRARVPARRARRLGARERAAGHPRGERDGEGRGRGAQRARLLRAAERARRRARRRRDGAAARGSRHGRRAHAAPARPRGARAAHVPRPRPGLGDAAARQRCHRARARARRQRQRARHRRRRDALARGARGRARRAPGGHRARARPRRGPQRRRGAVRGGRVAARPLRAEPRHGAAAHPRPGAALRAGRARARGGGERLGGAAPLHHRHRLRHRDAAGGDGATRRRGGRSRARSRVQRRAGLARHGVRAACPRAGGRGREARGGTCTAECRVLGHSDSCWLPATDAPSPRGGSPPLVDAATPPPALNNLRGGPPPHAACSTLPPRSERWLAGPRGGGGRERRRAPGPRRAAEEALSPRARRGGERAAPAVRARGAVPPDVPSRRSRPRPRRAERPRDDSGVVLSEGRGSPPVTPKPAAALWHSAGRTGRRREALCLEQRSSSIPVARRTLELHNLRTYSSFAAHRIKNSLPNCARATKMS